MAANLFPIGAISSGSSSGTIDGVTYTFFEPNDGCISIPSGNVLISTFEEKTILTRKKAEPILTVKYSYENILQREFREIEHFVATVAGDGLNPFFAVAFDRGETPTSVAASSTVWSARIANTNRFYSSNTKEKAYFAFVTDGNRWKMGKIIAKSGTRIHIDISASTYGSLAVGNANTDGDVFPVYKVYMTPKQLQNSFQKTVFVPGDVNATSDGGYMVSGELLFTTAFKV